MAFQWKSSIQWLVRIKRVPPSNAPQTIANKLNQNIIKTIFDAQSLPAQCSKKSASQAEKKDNPAWKKRYGCDNLTPIVGEEGAIFTEFLHWNLR
jgi:hypothetical protein